MHPVREAFLMEDGLRELRMLLEEQAADALLWDLARTHQEAYLQRALRCLHDVIERATWWVE